MPVGMLTASASGGAYVMASLRETLLVMEAKLVEAAALAVASVRQKIDAEGRCSDPVLLAGLRASLLSLRAAA